MKPTLTFLTLSFLLIATAAARGAEPVRLSLDGAWQLQEQGSGETLPATVPGVVQTDLLAAGKFQDPFDQDNARQQEWIDQKTWVYTRTFTVPAELKARKRAVLRFEGLDTIATIVLNGHEVSKVDNMFRTYEFDVESLLVDGTNTLSVTFSPLEPYIEAFKQAAPKVSNAVGVEVANVRKSAYMNGWDFAPRARSAGIYKHVELVGFDRARFRGVVAESTLSPARRRAAVRITPNVDGSIGFIRAVLVDPDGVVVAEKKSGTGPAVELTVNDPKLWWPRGMGEQPVYELRVEVLDGGDAVMDTCTRRIGFRTIEVRPKEGEQSMHMVVNGKPFFAKGASWVPADLFLPRVDKAKLEQLLQDAADANMNMVRSWGGGAYEDDAFYDACDRLGLLVWFDFKFACTVYPGGNERFANNVRAEIIDQVTRLGSHPSIAVWCGNNECLGAVTGFKMLSQADYDAFFQGVVGKQLASLLPNAAFVDGSPGPAGDEHNWWVWHIGADFEHYRESHGFMSEFGFQSFPHPATVESYTRPVDRESVLTPIMKAHQHNGNGKGNDMILDVTSRYFRPAKDFESTLWLSQINQAYGMEIGIDHWRGDWPKSGGALVWQLNDCYPGPSWSLIDYYGRRKAAWYAVRRAFAPVSIEAVVDATTHIAHLKINSDLPEAITATLAWTITDLGDTVFANESTQIEIPKGSGVFEGLSVDLSAHWDERTRRVAVIEIYTDKILATKTVTLVRPKELDLQPPQWETPVVPDGDGYKVYLNTNGVVALWTWLELDGDPEARFSDNFVDLLGKSERTIRVTPSKPLAIEQFRQRLKVRSLFDTYDAGH